MSFKSDLIDTIFFSWFNTCIEPRGRGRQPPGDKILMSKDLITLPISYKFQKILFEVLFYTIFFHDFIHVYNTGTRADNPLGTKFWCQQEHLVTSVIYCKFQKNLFEVWFNLYNFFMI